MSAIYDNWERLVAAVIKKQQLWELFHEQSRSPSILSDASDFTSSFHDLSFHFSSQQSPPQLVLLSDFIPPFDVNCVSTELLGRGTFGSAYVAKMDGGEKIVVKSLKSVDISELDFKRFMEIVGDVRHENVVALRAYYSSSVDHKLLLYDYYTNGSVYSLLHGQTGENRADVDWETRVRIAIGAARGIAAIHTQLGGMLVHGNIKASNILLNQELYGCVSDFGLANMITTTFMPSANCYAPEVKNTQNTSQASDVYSFGILLLELLTRKPTAHAPGGPEPINLVKLVNSVKSKERAAKVFDPDLLKHPTISQQMIKMLQIGIRCVAKSAKERPKIFEVVKMLEDIVILEGKLVFLEHASPIFEFEQLMGASADMLGKGSFATCYKATLDNGNIVVVKRLRKVTTTFKDFQQHMEVFGRMNHINVGRLKAYYYTRDEKFLVYDYFDEGSLAFVLHGTRGVIGASLDWETRVKIAVGAARGIAHIHTQNGRSLVLGNIKSSNILIKGKNCSIGFDAGLAKLLNPVRRSYIPSPGYCAPEASSGEVSRACDVYSFGVVLLELVSRRPAGSLAEWIRSVDRSEWAARVLDEECCGYGNEEAMLQVLEIAMGCVSIVPEHRPTMFGVVKELEVISGVESEIVLDDDSWEESSIQSRLECLLEDLLPVLSP